MFMHSDAFAITGPVEGGLAQSSDPLWTFRKHAWAHRRAETIFRCCPVNHDAHEWCMSSAAS